MGMAKRRIQYTDFKASIGWEKEKKGDLSGFATTSSAFTRDSSMGSIFFQDKVFSHQDRKADRTNWYIQRLIFERSQTWNGDILIQVKYYL